METTSHTFYLNHESHSLSQLLLLLISCSPEVSVKTTVYEVTGEPSIQKYMTVNGCNYNMFLFETLKLIVFLKNSKKYTNLASNG